MKNNSTHNTQQLLEQAESYDLEAIEQQHKKEFADVYARLDTVKAKASPEVVKRILSKLRQ